MAVVAPEGGEDLVEKALREEAELNAVLDQVRERFAEKAADEGDEDLSREAFKELVIELMPNDPPDERDLEAAFKLADEDGGGTVGVARTSASKL